MGSAWFHAKEIPIMICRNLETQLGLNQQVECSQFIIDLFLDPDDSVFSSSVLVACGSTCGAPSLGGIVVAFHTHRCRA